MNYDNDASDKVSVVKINISYIHFHDAYSLPRLLLTVRAKAGGGNKRLAKR